METLEKSRMCRLCGKQSGISVDIFDKNESHVRKINAILPILVHEMDLLPKQMCHRCSYKLEEFFNFYVECAKTDRELKSQLSWMSKEDVEENNSIPMVKMNKFKIKTEPLDNDSTGSQNACGKFGGSSVIFPASILQYESNSNLTLPCAQCKCMCDNKSIKINKTSLKSIKFHSNSVSENKAHNFQIIGNEPCVLIEPMCVNHKVNLMKDSKSNQINSLQKTTNNDSEAFVTLDIDDDVLKSEKLNRALRPRKGSIDYIGPKKKVTTTNLKNNIKNKLDDIDLSLVKPANIRITPGNANHPSPIIKLEKVDDAVKSLRTQQNLKLFYKRVKELQLKKKNLYKKENQHGKSFWAEASQNKKNEKLKETSNSPLSKKSQKGENSPKKNVKTDKCDKYNLQSDVNLNEECLTSSNIQFSNNELSIVETKIKQEEINTVKNDESSVHSVQENTLQSNDRFPFCSVIKLENDYSCNVDYPKIQIKQHITTTNSVNSQDSRSNNSAKQKKDRSKHATNKKLTVRDNTFLKNLRSKQRKMKIKNNHHKTRSWKKKNSRQLNLNSKRTVFNKELSMILSQSELKCYCEQCNTSFGNKELYKLHPCYQN
ncbi:uncharacterized protein PF3D7_0207100-like [Phymastichus coffea]|uniref:uncharacterized protein PF3D7_0207100-like n=1 Tax=Phymastichus coffea TaxID=108790 RepID=UPI00273B706E|nr:uncharacterized protein PF3D7_0207100-like [Phymastichus coffea]